MTTSAQLSPLYATKAFMVEFHPELDAARLTRLRQPDSVNTISSVTFVGEDAELFLLGLQDARTKLLDEEVEIQYLNRYGPLMQVEHLQ